MRCRVCADVSNVVLVLASAAAIVRSAQLAQKHAAPVYH
eukprot:COSAG04_NODE_20946_length_383_cov_0.661972_1_plen_38_part_01